MNTMKKPSSNIFGALKLIEQLYRDSQIPEYVFRNILKEYDGTVDLSTFRRSLNVNSDGNEVQECTG